MLTWDAPTELYYHHGLDRGVAYIPGVGAVPWNGLTGFDEGSEAPTASVMYRDGLIYLAEQDPSDFTGRIAAISWPNEMSKCLGMPEAADGLFVDNQKPTRFSFCYRSLVGSGLEGDMFGYQLHLVYNAVASMSQRSRRTLGQSDEPLEFGFDLVCTPVKLVGYRPTAHYVIDTRNMSPAKVAQIETLLYDNPTPPDPQDLFDIMNYGDGISVINQVAPKTFQVDGSYENVEINPDGTVTFYNINASAPDSNGQYVISTGGNTTVVDG